MRDDLDHIKVGDPDPTPPDGDCPAHLNGFVCTRYAGHIGQHIAGNGEHVLAVD